MIEENKNKKSKKIESPVGEELFPEKNSPKKRKKDLDSAGDLLKYLKSTFPIINTLITDFSKTNSVDNLKINKKLEKFEKTIESLNKDISSIKKDFEKTNTKIDSIIPTITSIDKTLLTANEQRELSMDLAEERDLENKKEQAYIEEERAETQEDQNAEIISKLGTIDETLNNLDISGGKSGGLLDFLKNIASGLLPLIVGGLSAMVGSLASLAGAIFSSPIFLTLAAAALGAGVGYMLYKTVVEPWMKKEEEDTLDSLSGILKQPGVKGENIVTDKGEQVFSKTDSKTGETSYVTESQMKSEVAAKQEERKKKIQAGEKISPEDDSISYSVAQNTIDVQSGQYMNDPIVSGQSIEQINEAAKEIERTNASLSPSEKAQKKYAKEITRFDESFRNQLAKTMTAQNKMGGTKNALLGGREIFKEIFSKLYDEHMNIINAVRRDKNLTPDDKNELMKLSPLFQKAFTENGSDPDYDTVWLLGYDLPNGQGITIDWNNSLPTDKENRAKIDSEFGSPSGRAEALKKKYDAKAALEKQQNQEVAKVETSSPESPTVNSLNETGSEMVAPKDSYQNEDELERERREMVAPKGSYKDENGNWVVPPRGKTETAINEAKIIQDQLNQEERIKRELRGEKNIPKLETGGVVIPKTNMGVFANISENMKPEAVVPLDKYVIQTKEQYSAEKTKNAEAYNVGDDITNIIRSSYFEEKDSNVQQQPIIVNNVNNNKQTAGSVGDPTNFGFQSNMAKTFDNIFDLILEKNMKMGIN